MESFLFQATLYLAAGVVAVPLSVRLGLGSVLGYLIAGIAIGPVFGLVGSETADLQHFAEFGVVMMLFLIGLELEPRAIWDMRMRLLGLGGLQVVGTMAVITGGAMAFGQPPTMAIAIGMILALSSTAIVLQTLTEKGLMQTNGGRSCFSVLLTQDIAVIPMLALLPLLAIPGALGHATVDTHTTVPGSETVSASHAEAAVAMIDALPAWGVTLATLGAVGLVILFGAFATRPIFRYLHVAKLPELYTAFALLIVIGIAFLMSVVGLSPALGTFLAGVVLANTEFRHELESAIEPFKGLLLGLFFITVGAGIRFQVLFDAPTTILGLTLLTMFAKGLVLYIIARVFRMGMRNRWLFTLGLAQAGEFGFVLVSFSLQQSVLPADLGELLLLVIALSMLLTPLFFIAYDKLARRAPVPETPEPDEIDDQQPIIIAGIGRFGQVVNRMLQLAGFQTTVLDHDLNTIQLMRRFGFKGFFGDPTRPELLHAAGLDTARVLVVAMDDGAAAVRLVEYARRRRPDLHIVARARDRVHVYKLYRAGANDIVRELFDSSLRAGRYVLENMGMTDREASDMERTFYRLDRAALRDLAELWIPGLPVSRNDAYIERARALNNELESELMKRFDTDILVGDPDDDEDEADAVTRAELAENDRQD
ncbi:potassium transporter [Mesobaculum littorinae]|uniref:Potassium transporter n=1 Tax=Mesobaculum littorinae TaxID=2486419 RepID=A0A438ALS5_9RHOB|nr:cation:proton antiporter [Mesobaculum littorinae]RVV99803.1 potassium transporter [Mesobaculum littorinae]